MSKNPTAFQRLRNEKGSAEVFAFMLTFPLLFALIFFAWISMSYRDTLRLPVEQVVNSYTQQFAAYGSNTLPPYAANKDDGLGVTVTDRMSSALLALPQVKSFYPDGKGWDGRPICGALRPGGVIDPSAVIYAATAVGCKANVDLQAWTYSTVFGVTDVLFGGDYAVYSTAFTDKGANPNIK